MLDVNTQREELFSSEIMVTKPGVAPPFDPKSLAVYAARDEFLKLLAENDFLIVEAATGTGKSTLLPQFVLDSGLYDQTVVTMPRIPAAYNTAQFVSSMRGEELGKGKIGFRCSEYKIDGSDRQVLYCTDGLQFMREIMQNAGHRDVLFIDEAHEPGINITALMAYAREQIKNGGGFKLVVMSATLQSGNLQKYLNNCPILKVEGKRYDVEEVWKPGKRDDIPSDVPTWAEKVGTAAVVETGVKEVERLAEAIREKLEAKGLNIPVFTLTSKSTFNEQQLCFDRSIDPKIIVGTDIIISSLTLPGLTGLFHTGLTKKPAIVDRLEGLYTVPISQSDYVQAMGRVGRETEGHFFYYGDLPKESLKLEHSPEILSTRFTKTYLQYALAGIHMEHYEFLHQPDNETIQRVKQILTDLKCLNTRGEVTKIGRRVLEIPLEVFEARMIEQAEHLEGTAPGIVEDMIGIAAVSEVGGLCDGLTSRWKKYAGNETDSDHIAHYKAFLKILEMQETSPVPLDLRNLGIDPKRFEEIKSLREKISVRLERSDKPGLTNRFDHGLYHAHLIYCIQSGLLCSDHIFQRKGKGEVFTRDDIHGKTLTPRLDSVAGAFSRVLAVPYSINDKSILQLSVRLTREDVRSINNHLLPMVPEEKRFQRRGYKADRLRIGA